MIDLIKMEKIVRILK